MVKVVYKDEVIAEFKKQEDAEIFVDLKRKKMLFGMSGQMIDRIAAETGLDRRFPGIFPSHMAGRYYGEAVRSLETDLRIEAG